MVKKNGSAKHVDTVISSVEQMIESTASEADRFVGPYRKSVLGRFPHLVIGLSTFGIVAIFYSFEKIIDSIPFLAERPFLILLLGVAALAVTGTVYKKLG